MIKSYNNKLKRKLLIGPTSSFFENIKEYMSFLTNIQKGYRCRENIQEDMLQFLENIQKDNIFLEIL